MTDPLAALPVECFLPVIVQGLEPVDFFGFWNRLSRSYRLCSRVIPKMTQPTPVDCDDMTRGFDKSLGEDHGDYVSFDPVPEQLTADQRQDVESEIGDLDPGKDREPGVVDHRGQVLLPQFRRPADERSLGRVSRRRWRSRAWRRASRGNRSVLARKFHERCQVKA